MPFLGDIYWYVSASLAENTQYHSYMICTSNLIEILQAVIVWAVFFLYFTFSHVAACQWHPWLLPGLRAAVEKYSEMGFL
jgi:hypothetical protein